MIHYQLVCDQDHRFDGWFRDSQAFDKQAKAGLVGCPECAGVRVHRALMAPAIGRSRKGAAAEPAAEPVPAPAPVAPTQAVPDGMVPDRVRAMLQRLRAEVERNCEPVGERFAEEVRAIHRGETEARPIYGDATPEQAEALADEGIEVARIPWIPRADG